MSKYISFIVGCLLSSQAFCNWNPSYPAPSDAKFLQLKEKVLKSTENSWCSPAKTTLIMDLMFHEKPEVCVEIGVFTGSSFLPISATLKHLNKGKAYGIDPWSNQEAIRFMETGDPNKEWWSTLDMKSIYMNFTKMIKLWGLKSYCTILKTTSAQAAKEIDRIDFLHMDGNYTRECSIDDVFRYLPKVKKGGYILLSNLLVSINDDHPKMDAFDYLLEQCEYVCEVDDNNCILLRKTAE